jgi:hypothetical protein
MKFYLTFFLCFLLVQCTWAQFSLTPPDSVNPNKLSRDEIRDLLMSQPEHSETYLLGKKSRRLSAQGDFLYVIGGSVAITGVIFSSFTSLGHGLILGGLATVTSGIIFQSHSREALREGVLLYCSDHPFNCP